MKITRCPYCGKRLNYFQAFYKRKRGEHICRGCGRNSTIYFPTSYRAVVGVVVILAIILVVIFTSEYFSQNLWCMLYVAVPFLLLYLITPFFLRLSPIKKNGSKVHYNVDTPKSNDASIPSSETKIMDKINFDGVDDEEEFDISNLDVYKESEL